MKILTAALAFLALSSTSFAAEEKVLDCALHTTPDYNEYRIGLYDRFTVTRDEAGNLTATALAPAYDKAVDLGHGTITVSDTGLVLLSFDEGDTYFTLGYNESNYRYEGEGALEEDFASSVSCEVFSEF